MGLFHFSWRILLCRFQVKILHAANIKNFIRCLTIKKFTSIFGGISAFGMLLFPSDCQFNSFLMFLSEGF